MTAQIIPIMSRDDDAYTALASSVGREAAAVRIMADQSRAIAKAYVALVMVKRMPMPQRLKNHIETAIKLIEGAS